MENVESISCEVETPQIAQKKTPPRAGFFERNYAMFFAPLIVLFIYICALWRYDVYPFGNKFTAASYDLSAQICPFIEHLFDVINGKSTLTYSYAIAGGADVTGTFLYFFISPFSFLFLILGEGKVAHASAIVMMCKLAVIAVSGAWFAKKLFKNIPDYLCIAIGVVYTYCGYTFVANTYINWMDFLIYLPFCAGAFRRFVKTGKYLLFAVLMSACIYTCFSIACFSMLTVFPCLIAYALLCVEKTERKTFITKLCLAFVIAVLLALPVLLPSFMATSNSARTGGFFDRLWFGYVEKSGKEVFDKKTFLDKLEKAAYAKFTYIFTDAIFILLTMIWFFRKGLKNKFAQFMLVAAILTLLPVLVDEAMLLLNFGSYYSYALRFGFLNALFFLGGACLCLEDVCFKHTRAYDGSALDGRCDAEEIEEVEKDLSDEEFWAKDKGTQIVEKTQNGGGMVELNEKSTRTLYKQTDTKKAAKIICLVALAVVAVIATAILVVMFVGADKLAPMSSSDYTKFLHGTEEKAGFLAKFPKSWQDNVKEACDKLRTMDGSFTHSLGNMEIIAIVFIVVMFVGGLGVWFVADRKMSARMASYFLLVVVGAQILFFNGQLVIGNRSEQYKRLDAFTEAVEILQDMDDSYYRIKDFGNKDGNGKVNETLLGNAPLVAGSNCFSVFSSVIEDYNFIYYPLFGRTKPTNSMKSNDRNKSFADAFLGYKYYWVRYQTDDVEAADALSYLKPVYKTNENGKQSKIIVGETGDKYTLYENEIVFPSAYIVEDGEFRFAKENITANSYANQKALYEFLGGEKYEGTDRPGIAQTRKLSKKLHDQGVEVEIGAGKITAKATAGNGGQCLFLNFVASRGYSVTVNGKKAELVDNDLKFLCVALEEGENVVEFTYSSPYAKLIGVGFIMAVLGLAVVALLLLKTRIVEIAAPVISWAGVILAIGLVAFFMLYPTCVFVTKLIALLGAL